MSELLEIGVGERRQVHLSRCFILCLRAKNPSQFVSPRANVINNKCRSKTSARQQFIPSAGGQTLERRLEDGGRGPKQQIETVAG